MSVEQLENRLQLMRHLAAMLQASGEFHHTITLDEYVKSNPTSTPSGLKFVQLRFGKELWLGVQQLMPCPPSDRRMEFATALPDIRLFSEHPDDVAALKVLDANSLSRPPAIAGVVDGAAASAPSAATSSCPAPSPKKGAATAPVITLKKGSKIFIALTP